jgi:hypothetical protein
MPTQPLHITGRRFLEKIVRIRLYLIRTGHSNNPEAEHAARFLNMQLSNFAYATDELMAGFLLRHETDIRECMPDASSSCGKKLLKEFNKLMEEIRT